MIFYILQKFNAFACFFNRLNFLLLNSFLVKTSFLLSFYKKNELIFQEGLLIDFLQKKSFDLWTKKFLIYSSYLFSEKWIFDKIVKFFINLILNPIQKLFVFEFSNVGNFFFINIFFYFLIFFCIVAFFLIFF